jgi:hypothetical protein
VRPHEPASCASFNELLDPDHDLGAQSKVARFGLSKSESPEHIAATTCHLHSPRQGGNSYLSPSRAVKSHSSLSVRSFSSHDMR